MGAGSRTATPAMTSKLIESTQGGLGLRIPSRIKCVNRSPWSPNRHISSRPQGYPLPRRMGGNSDDRANSTSHANTREAKR
jgi:hypothetical protein